MQNLKNEINSQGFMTCVQVPIGSQYPKTGKAVGYTAKMVVLEIPVADVDRIIKPDPKKTRSKVNVSDADIQGVLEYCQKINGWGNRWNTQDPERIKITRKALETYTVDDLRMIAMHAFKKANREGATKEDKLFNRPSTYFRPKNIPGKHSEALEWRKRHAEVQKAFTLVTINE